MDWLKLFTLLVAVTSVSVTADGTKKKIRIHLPQKVKHIHHHKKIYITNHAAPSQYAPAFMPSAEGAVAVPTNIALPTVAKIVPFNSVEVFEESQARLPGATPAASKLLPLYHARGYYGPNHSEWDEQEYDLLLPPEPTENTYVPPAATVITASSNNPPKRIKVVKLTEVPRKKVTQKGKPKRVTVRNRPQPEEEHPVSTFHEQFYSDLDGSGTIRKIKKPQRVEKIIDGDTEHIHTYSEEHIHKVVFDDSPKVTGVVGIDPVGSMSALSAAHQITPYKNSQGFLAIPDAYTGLTGVGSLGTPSHLEYTAYNPREVTHDHIFHDHGEIPLDMDITKDHLGFPPKVSYNSQGLRLPGPKVNRIKPKRINKYGKPTKAPISDFSYYESMYTPHNTLRSVVKSAHPTHYEPSPDVNIDNYRPIPSFKFNDNGSNKPSPTQLYGNVKPTDSRLQQLSVPAPFSLSSTVVHDYKPKTYAASGSAPVVLSNFKDPFVNFKNIYPNNFEYDTYASSSNIYTTEDKGKDSPFPQQSRQKSISTQNISFGELDHQTVVDHMDASSAGMSDDLPTAIGDYEGFEETKQKDKATSIPYTPRETSPAHLYYSFMTNKLLDGDHLSSLDVSNDDFQYAEEPTPSTKSPSSTVPTNSPQYYKIQSTDAITIDPINFITESRPIKKSKQKSKPNSTYRYPANNNNDHIIQRFETQFSYNQNGSLIEADKKGKLKYGDKI